MGCFDDYNRPCGPAPDIRQESRVIANQLDRGDPQLAADMLRRDLQSMPPGAAAALLRETQEKDARGFRSDLEITPVLGRDQFNRVYDTGVRDVSIYDNNYGTRFPVARLNAAPQPYYENRPGYPQQRIDPLAALSTVIIAGAIAGAINGGRGRDHDHYRHDRDGDGDRRRMPLPFPIIIKPRGW
jgi:hypothetical protein